MPLAHRAQGGAGTGLFEALAKAEGRPARVLLASSDRENVAQRHARPATGRSFTVAPVMRVSRLRHRNALVPVRASCVGAAHSVAILMPERPLDSVWRPLAALVQKRGGRRPKAMRDHLVARIAEASKRGIQRVLADGTRGDPGARKYQASAACDRMQPAQDRQRLRRQRHAMFAPHLRAPAGDGPNGLLKTELSPVRQVSLARTR